MSEKILVHTVLPPAEGGHDRADNHRGRYKPFVRIPAVSHHPVLLIRAFQEEQLQPHPTGHRPGKEDVPEYPEADYVHKR